MTARDLISASLRLLGVLASGEALSANEATDGLSSLNDLLDSWSTENLLIPNKVREVFALTVSKKSYTMGSGGDLNTTRPMRIENALLQITGNTPPLEIPMKILTKDQFAGVILKELQSTYPLYVYPEGTAPLETINLWPVPNQVNSIVLYSWKPLADLPSLSTELTLPPGYQRAMKYNLAIELAPEYGRAVPDIVGTLALESKGNIKRMNSRSKYLRVDDSLRAKPAVWNWMTGEPT